MPNWQQLAVLFICGAWLLWAAIWAGLSLGTKKTIRQEGLRSRALHLGPLAIATALLIAGNGFGALLNAAILPRAAWMLGAGAALVAAGLGFAVWARLTLAGNWSGTVTLKQSHELIRTGPYAVVRHPIYTGLLTALLGTAIAVDAWRGLLAVVIVAASFLRKMRTEEAFMRAAFGAAYETYSRATPALVPRVRK